MAKNIFNTVKIAKPGKSVFDLSHDVKMSLKFGTMYPTVVMETVPGDSFSLSCESLLRFAPLVAPVMQRIDVFMHYFFVPNRLVWPGWENFITQQPYDGTPPVHPFVTADTASVNAIIGKAMSYFGIGSNNSSFPDPPDGLLLNPIPFAAYQMIYNEYYRDQNLCPEVNFTLANGDNTSDLDDLTTLRVRAWEHDYFTSALPFAQKGPQVAIPFEADVVLKDDVTMSGKFMRSLDHTIGDTGTVTQAGVTPNLAVTLGGVGHVYDPQGSLEVVNGESSINDLRRAFRLQEWYEKQARGGTRYIESILAHFGVKSSDARLQRPEYITGTKSPVSISEVLSSNGDESGNLGDMGGHGISVTTGNYGKFYAEEHGTIIGIMTVLPRTGYATQTNKLFFKVSDPFEYYWPEFANIGEQEIRNKEIFLRATTPEGIFGYIPRYAEYKYMNSRVAGDFGSSLAFWHQARFADETTALNQEFIECNPRTDIFAVDDGTDYLWAHVYHKIRAVRPMPYFGTPTI